MSHAQTTVAVDVDRVGGSRGDRRVRGVLKTIIQHSSIVRTRDSCCLSLLCLHVPVPPSLSVQGTGVHLLISSPSRSRQAIKQRLISNTLSPHTARFICRGTTPQQNWRITTCPVRFAVLGPLPHARSPPSAHSLTARSSACCQRTNLHPSLFLPPCQSP
jgi:hypothetical protein